MAFCYSSSNRLIQSFTAWKREGELHTAGGAWAFILGIFTVFSRANQLFINCHISTAGFKQYISLQSHSSLLLDLRPRLVS